MPIVVNVFGNGDLLLRSPLAVQVAADMVSVGSCLEQIRNSARGTDPTLQWAEYLFTLSGVRVVSVAQLIADPVAVASSDSAFLPRVAPAVEAFRKRQRLAPTRSDAVPQRPALHAPRETQGSSPKLFRRALPPTQAASYGRLQRSDDEARRWLAESIEYEAHRARSESVPESPVAIAPPQAFRRALMAPADDDNDDGDEDGDDGHDDVARPQADVDEARSEDPSPEAAAMAPPAAESPTPVAAVAELTVSSDLPESALVDSPTRSTGAAGEAGQQKQQRGGLHAPTFDDSDEDVKSASSQGQAGKARPPLGHVAATKLQTPPSQPSAASTSGESAPLSPASQRSTRPSEPLGPKRVSSSPLRASSPRPGPTAGRLSSRAVSSPTSAGRGSQQDLSKFLVEAASAPPAALVRAPPRDTHAPARWHPDAPQHGYVKERQEAWASCFAAQGISVSANPDSAAALALEQHPVLFRGSIAEAVDAIASPADVHSVVTPLRLWLVGPEGSGRSAAVGVAAGELVLPAIGRPAQHAGGWLGDTSERRQPSSSTFSLPLSAHRLLPDAETDAAVWFCRLVQHAVHCVAAQCPAVAPEAARIASYWKAAVARRDAIAPVDDRISAALSDEVDATWPPLAHRLQLGYRRGHFANFIAAAWQVVHVLREAAGMAHTLFVVDDIDALRGKALVDWRTSRRVDADMLQAFLAHVAASHSACIATCVVAPRHPDLDRVQSSGGALPTCGIVPDSVATAEAGLPRWLVCGGKAFPLRIFGGCPGFLSTLKRHLDRGRALRPLGDGRAEVTDPTLLAVLEELALLRLDQSSPTTVVA